MRQSSTRVGRVPALFASALAAEPVRPLLTYYDDATGERTELSAEALAGWVARTANLLLHGCGLGIGARAAVLLPPHWQTAAVLLGTWSAGVSVSFHGLATAGLPALGPGVEEPFDVTYAALPRIGDWLDHVPEAEHRFVLGLAPDAAPLAAPPAGYRDYLTEVRGHDADLRPYVPLHPDDPASVDGTSYAEWGRLARLMATDLFDLRPGDRVLVDAAEHEHPVKWLLAPLAAGASVVLCANLDPDSVERRTREEQVTRML
ncbi:TIGR03089 family protein [Micromonospora sp. WMMD1102]|uniref:TIGR03089 family protein n=1 Tax=Micromonospora sp. WMMD1102 TaxID=3016105 RepID=UPI0024155A87|nr:TIGR03089 family protein [Micromonospora sp. WMMD1102]MDG4788523.1 TIGR03089 family protein [Micromonospora sp. WMMD1102]